MQQASSIFNNNNMTSQNFNSFSDEKFFRTLRILSCCKNSCHIFIKKTFVEVTVNVGAIFKNTAFCSKLFKIL